MRRLALPLLLAAAVGVAVLVPPSACAQERPADSRGERITADPGAQRAPIPPRYHLRNEGGSDGAGLCVIASGVASGMAQGIPGLDTPGAGTSNAPGNTGRVADAPGKGSALWLAARRAPGGYSPDKLKRLLAQVMPDEPYVSYYGTDTRVLDEWSKAGYPINATMNTGRTYNYQHIAHMVSVPHYEVGGYATVADNNNPGLYSVMPASEFDRRQDGGVFWAWIWARNPIRRPVLPDLSGASAPTLFALAGALLLLAAAALLPLLLPRKVTADA